MSSQTPPPLHSRWYIHDRRNDRFFCAVFVGVEYMGTSPIRWCFLEEGTNKVQAILASDIPHEYPFSLTRDTDTLTPQIEVRRTELNGLREMVITLQDKDGQDLAEYGVWLPSHTPYWIMRQGPNEGMCFDIPGKSLKAVIAHLAEHPWTEEHVKD